MMSMMQAQEAITSNISSSDKSAFLPLEPPSNLQFLAEQIPKITDAYVKITADAAAEDSTRNSSIKTVCIVGIVFTIILWCIASWRLIFHYTGCSAYNYTYCCNVNNDQHLTPISPRRPAQRSTKMTLKRMFHCLIWLAMTIEAIAYATLSGWIKFSSSYIENDKIGYILLAVIGRSILEYATFSVVTVIWFASPRRRDVLDKQSYIVSIVSPSLLGFMFLIITAISIWEIVDLFTGGYYNLDIFDKQSRAHHIRLAVAGVAWLFHSFIVFICSYMFFNRIRQIPTYITLTSNQKMKVILRKVYPMLLCALCYLLRSVWLLVDYTNATWRDTSLTSSEGWWVGCGWIPTFVPAVVAFFSFRKRDRVPAGSVEGVTDVSILPEPNSSEEAFASFRESLDGVDGDGDDDFVDDSFVPDPRQSLLTIEESSVEEDSTGSLVDVPV